MRPPGTIHPPLGGGTCIFNGVNLPHPQLESRRCSQTAPRCSGFHLLREALVRSQCPLTASAAPGQAPQGRLSLSRTASSFLLSKESGVPGVPCSPAQQRKGPAWAWNTTSPEKDPASLLAAAFAPERPTEVFQAAEGPMVRSHQILGSPTPPWCRGQSHPSA